jgi:hypothetical protein
MARADLLKRLFEAYQRRDDQGFRLAADELVDDERKKHHAVVANELQRILSNGVRSRREDATVDLHQELHSRIRPRARQRARIKQTG